MRENIYSDHSEIPNEIIDQLNSLIPTVQITDQNGNTYESNITRQYLESLINSFDPESKNLPQNPSSQQQLEFILRNFSYLLSSTSTDVSSMYNLREEFHVLQETYYIEQSRKNYTNEVNKLIILQIIESLGIDFGNLSEVQGSIILNIYAEIG